jgi:hypothetical protein
MARPFPLTMTFCPFHEPSMKQRRCRETGPRAGRGAVAQVRSGVSLRSTLSRRRCRSLIFRSKRLSSRARSPFHGRACAGPTVTNVDHTPASFPRRSQLSVTVYKMYTCLTPPLRKCSGKNQSSLARARHKVARLTTSQWFCGDSDVRSRNAKMLRIVEGRAFHTDPHHTVAA